jgi:transcriptional regulator with XRE-family HTH domain
MSPRSFVGPTSPGVEAALRRFRVQIAGFVRTARLGRRWTVDQLAERAGLSKRSVYLTEQSEPISIEVLARLAVALGLRLDLVLSEPTRRDARMRRALDPVHAAMGEFEADHFLRLDFTVGIDEPYQHYQFAGRADLIAWHTERRALLHIENRTRFPDIQDAAGSFNAKRAYLAYAVGERLGVRRWDVQTHVMAALWSSEVIRSIRRHPGTFESLCPDPVEVFDNWWAGRLLGPRASSVFVLLDPWSEGRARRYIGLEDALTRARPRYRGYAEAAARLART